MNRFGRLEQIAQMKYFVINDDAYKYTKRAIEPTEMMYIMHNYTSCTNNLKYF